MGEKCKMADYVSSNDLDRPLSKTAKLLFDEAVGKYRASTMWYMRPTATRRGAEAVARALEKYGDLAAAKLAARLRRACRDAA